MEAIAALISLALALFIAWSSPCDKKNLEYRTECKICCERDICEIRWKLEELNDEDFLLELEGMK